MNLIKRTLLSESTVILWNTYKNRLKSNGKSKDPFLVNLSHAYNSSRYFYLIKLDPHKALKDFAIKDIYSFFY